jgi:hypothetical protein
MAYEQQQPGTGTSTGPGRGADAPRADRRGGSGVPDGLLVGGVLLLIGIATLVWTSTGLAGLVQHGRWPAGVAFQHTGRAVRSFLTAPRDVPEAWPDSPPAELPSGTMLWLVFLTQLVILFATALLIAMRVARWRARRAERRLERGVERGVREAPSPPAAAHEPEPAVEQAVEYGEPVPEVPAPAATSATSATSPANAANAASAASAVAAVLDGPEGLVVVDPDGRLWARTARQRGKLGPVHVYDPGHATDAPVRLRWAPQRGCEDMAVARRRAAALLAPVRPTEPVFQLDAETAETLLRCYLHAAALAGEPVQQVHRWANGHAPGGAPGKILRTHPRVTPGASMELESALTTHPGRRDAALELIGRALGGLDQLHIRQSCSPGRVDTLALDNVGGEGGTLYVVGDHKETAGLRQALTEAVTTGQPGLTVIGSASPASPASPAGPA